VSGMDMIPFSVKWEGRILLSHYIFSGMRGRAV
jgi:hypothetical protein